MADFIDHFRRYGNGKTFLHTGGTSRKITAESWRGGIGSKDIVANLKTFAVWHEAEMKEVDVKKALSPRLKSPAWKSVPGGTVSKTPGASFASVMLFPGN